ncbi:MAG: cytochrome b5-like heme/steroid binding domain-containing protein [Minisyncoccia bacterium]|jgi:cytochrome b involved in lipid metabolism
MRTKITLAICAVFLVGASIIALSAKNAPPVSQSLVQNPSGSDSSTSAPSKTAPVPTSGSKSGSSSGLNSSPGSGSNAKTQSSGYTMADVAKHNSASSCWTAINSKVYDLTNWIGQHPGGQQAILSICGIDGSAAFNNQHGGQSRPANELAAFYIGDLSSASSSASSSGNASAAAPSVPTGRTGSNRAYNDD